MIDLEQVARRARFASERGRARMAVRIATPIVALAAIPAVFGRGGGAGFAGLVVVLLASATFLRWRNRLGVEIVRVGLVIGAALAGATVAIHNGLESIGGDPFVPVTIASALAGAVPGLVVARWVSRVPRSSVRTQRWALTLLIAALAASVGAVRLGASGLAAALVSTAICSALVWAPDPKFVP